MKYYLIGIKGAGMSSLALILDSLGNVVIGYDDETKHQFTEDKLRSVGIKIYSKSNNELDKYTTVIRSSAISVDHPEMIKVRNMNLNIYEYQEFLGELTNNYYTIAVSGTHGKTTTSSLLKEVMFPTLGCNYLIGDGNGYAIKDNKYFIIEACEYRRNFLSYHPKISIITNIDLDHVGYYKDIEDIKNAFQEFIYNTQELVVIYGDEDNTEELKFKTKKLTYGLKEDNDVYAKEVNYSTKGIEFDVFLSNKFYYHFFIPFYGEHLLLNTLAAITVLNYLNISAYDIQKYLSNFKGANRRFQEVTCKDLIIIDDYAHHPEEIHSTINAVRQKYNEKKIIVVFEPHTLARTKKFYKEMAESLNMADEVYVLDIYNPRDNPLNYQGVTSELIIKNLNNGHYLKRDSNQLLKYTNEVIVFMSPKEIVDIKEKLINK